MIKVLTHLKKSNFIFLFVKLFYYIIFIEEVKTTISKNMRFSTKFLYLMKQKMIKSPNPSVQILDYAISIGLEFGIMTKRAKV